MKYFFRITIITLMMPIYILAQTGQTDAELANQYFSTGEYEKAVVYFDRFYDQDPFTAYAPYLKCLTAIKDYDKAEKLIKKQSKKFSNDITVKVDLGSIYELKNETDKAQKLYNDLIKNLAPDVNQVNSLGNAFTQRGQTELALQTYLQGRKLMKGTYPFCFELAEIYAQQGKFQEMVNEYLDMVEFHSGYIVNVQTIMQNKMANDLSGNLTEMFRTSLLRKVQKYPEEVEYGELLYWLFLQEKDYDAAYIQARAIDKRYNENGDRMISLGKLCVTNREYVAAEKCFQHVVDKGTASPLYITARMELINTINSRVTSSGSYTTDDLKKLEADYQKTLGELGKTASTAPLIRGLAHLKAFYLANTDEASTLLLETIELPQLRPDYKAECKLELADIYIFTGEVWEAALLYGQVDKDFKNDVLGREAKFRNARLSYYMGQFDWAKEQLGVLRSATSQLISNDAISLGLLIMDNMNLDTSTAALLIYSKAELLSFQNKDSLALITLDSILTMFPNHMLTDEVWYKKAFIYRKTKQWNTALQFLNDIVEKYPEDILADDALFDEADIYENHLANKEKAKELYELLVTKYPGSLYVVDARKRFRTLRGDKIN